MSCEGRDDQEPQPIEARRAQLAAAEALRREIWRLAELQGARLSIDSSRLSSFLLGECGLASAWRDPSLT